MFDVLATAPGRLPLPVLPARYLVLDLETNTPPDSEIDAALARWRPPANVKDPEKVAARQREAATRIADRSALLDAAPIACIAVHTDTVAALFNGVAAVDPDPGLPYPLLNAGDERALLLHFRDWVDVATGPATVIVGHNVLAFDLPKLRARYLAHRLHLPLCLQPRPGDEQPVIDTMRLFLRYFTPERHGEPMASLDEVVGRLALPQYKSLCDGALVPGLIAAGRIADVLAYCALDVAATRAVYLLLSGECPSLA